MALTLVLHLPGMQSKHHLLLLLSSSSSSSFFPDYYCYYYDDDDWPPPSPQSPSFFSSVLSSGGGGWQPVGRQLARRSAALRNTVPHLGAEMRHAGEVRLECESRTRLFPSLCVKRGSPLRGKQTGHERGTVRRQPTLPF